MKQFRQGDVLVQEISKIPKDAEPQQGRVILAHGEVTGHCHEIAGKAAKLLTEGEDLFLELAKPKELTHQEHGPINIPAGSYQVVRQREYSPEAVRNVAD
jgi:hypothetical protein